MTGCNLRVTRQLSLRRVTTTRPALRKPLADGVGCWARHLTAHPSAPRPGVGDVLPEELNCHLLWSCLPSLALMGWKQRWQ